MHYYSPTPTRTNEQLGAETQDLVGSDHGAAIPYNHKVISVLATLSITVNGTIALHAQVSHAHNDETGMTRSLFPT